MEPHTAAELHEAALAAEESIDQQERALLARAAQLEAQVQQHKQQKEAIRTMRIKAEEQRAAEFALERWQSELKKETDAAIGRLNEQRAQQLARCHQFDQQLQVSHALCMNTTFLFPNCAEAPN